MAWSKESTATSALGAKQKLERRMTSGQPSPNVAPKQLKLTAIEEVPEYFQHREPLEHQSVLHVRELAKVPSQGQPLDPITVLWVGDGWVCVDGHHRLAAYREAKWKRPIPVRVFKGSLDQAALEAAKNSHVHLPMRRDERNNAAWRLVNTTEATKPEIMRATGASEGTVASMRRVRRILETQEGDPAGMSWLSAWSLYKGTHKPQREWDDDRTEKEAKKLANSLVKAIGKLPYHMKQDVFARALEIYDSQLPAFLLQQWRHREDLRLPEEDEEEENMDF